MLVHLFFTRNKLLRNEEDKGGALLIYKITSILVEKSRKIFGDALVGIYLHGSAVMGCFHEKKSDIDIIVVVNTAISDEVKRQYMDMIVECNTYAPPKGIELSIVKEDVCKPFVYPTPFELHFSNAHLQWYKTDPIDYVEKMKGVDKDLAAHFTIIYHRGKCLYGKEIKDVFAKVDRESYFDSIWNDVENAAEEIRTNPTYIILNLCRVLAYQKDGMILSKQEGGRWGIEHVPEKYHGLILQALKDYASDEQVEWKDDCAQEYVSYMIENLKGV